MLLQYNDGHEMEVVIFPSRFLVSTQMERCSVSYRCAFYLFQKNERKTFEYFTRSYLALVTYRL